MPCSIFVGNLPPSISEYDLEDIITTSFNLKGWKLIEDVRVKRTAQGKAFAFVTLSSEQTAHDVLTIYNRKISQAICQRYACYGIRLELARRQKTDRYSRQKLLSSSERRMYAAAEAYAFGKARAGSRASSRSPAYPLSASTVFARQPSPRHLGPRSPNLPARRDFLAHPFSYITAEALEESDERIGELYPLHGKYGITRTLPGRPEHDPGDFPHNILFRVWSFFDGRSEGRYYLLCLLDNGLFAYYRADACYTGFSCAPGCSMRLYLSPEPDTLILQAMTDAEYHLYATTTAPVPVWTPCDAETIARRVAWAMLGHRRLGARYPLWTVYNLWAAALGDCPDALGKVGEMVWAERSDSADSDYDDYDASGDINSDFSL